MTIVPANLQRAFRGAGWFEGRQVAVDPAVPTGHPAEAVLAEVGGLVLQRPASNVGSIEFQHVTMGESTMAAWSSALATRIVGIAEQDDGHGELYMTQGGIVLFCSLVHPACAFVGRTFADAMESIGRSERKQPMLLPHQSEVVLYGTVFRQGDDGVLGPGSPELA